MRNQLKDIRTQGTREADTARYNLVYVFKRRNVVFARDTRVWANIIAANNAAHGRPQTLSHYKKPPWEYALSLRRTSEFR